MKMTLRATMALLVLGFSATAGANVPAPPVNQLLGIPDAAFSALTEAECRNCHGGTPDPSIPVDNTFSVVDRHHLLANMANPATIPQGTAAPYGTPGDTYECLSCHSLTDNGTSYDVSLVRNCLNCHQTVAGGTVHHATAAAQAGNCVACHGSLVQNGIVDTDGDGVINALEPDTGWVPTYSPSLVTPAPSNKVNSGPNGEGNCNFCHAAGDVVVNGQVTLSALSNANLHHNTGLYNMSDNPLKCWWCHGQDFNGDITENPPVRMRNCENCHGVPSLHNIQYDNAGDGIQPGQEAAGYGHIGAQADCNGCHGFSVPAAASFSPATALVPTIDSITASSVPAGKTANVTIHGNAITNVSNGTTFTSSARLIDEFGQTIDLQTLSLAPESMEVVVPQYLEVGKYRLVLDKNGQLSNPKIISIIPAVEISSVSCTDGTVTVTGSGFGDLTPEILAASPFGVDGSGKVTKRRRVQTVAETAEIISWTDTKVVAKFSTCMDQVEVSSLFGADTSSVTTSAPAKNTQQDRFARLLELLSHYRRR